MIILKENQKDFFCTCQVRGKSRVYFHARSPVFILPLSHLHTTSFGLNQSNVIKRKRRVERAGSSMMMMMMCAV